jgi:hypothetical protein
VGVTGWQNSGFSFGGFLPCASLSILQPFLSFLFLDGLFWDGNDRSQ